MENRELAKSVADTKLQTKDEQYFTHITSRLNNILVILTLQFLETSLINKLTSLFAMKRTFS